MERHNYSNVVIVESKTEIGRFRNVLKTLGLEIGEGRGEGKACTLALTIEQRKSRR